MNATKTPEEIARERFSGWSGKYPKGSTPNSLLYSQRKSLVDAIAQAIREDRERRLVWPSDEEIRGAVARGWCSEKNSHKEMDSDLALAISDEIIKLKSQVKWEASK